MEIFAIQKSSFPSLNHKEYYSATALNQVYKDIFFFPFPPFIYIYLLTVLAGATQRTVCISSWQQLNKHSFAKNASNSINKSPLFPSCLMVSRNSGKIRLRQPRKEHQTNFQYSSHTSFESRNLEYLVELASGGNHVKKKYRRFETEYFETVSNVC